MRKHFGHILGYTTLTVVLTAGAAQSLSGTNTVFSDDIVDGNVTTNDLGSNSVSRPKIQDNAVAAPEVADGSLTGTDIANNTLTGADIRTGRSYFSSGAVEVAANAVQTVQRVCPDGFTATGGGFEQSEAGSLIILMSSVATGDGKAWSVRVKNTTASATYVTVYVICDSLGL